MEEQFITFETAKLAKEKGFDISIDNQPYTDTTNPCCKDCINKREVDYYPNDYDCIICSTDDPDRWVSKSKVGQCDDFVRELFQKPTQSLLQKWLREKHHLIIIVAYQYEHDSTPYSYWIYKENNSLPINQWVNDLNTYEEALEAGLQKALSCIQNK